MNAISVYGLAYLSVVGLIATWRLSRLLTAQARQHIFSTLSKWLIYTLVFPRLNGTIDITVLAGLIITCVVIGNAVASIIGVHTKAELATRLARLCATNVTMLFLGGRTNFIVDKILRISHADYYLMHRWIGRISVVEGLVHGTLGIVQHRADTTTIDLTVGSDAYKVMTFSTLIQCRYFYC